MKLIKTDFERLVMIEPDLYEDKRGYFFESYNQKKFTDIGLQFNPVQDNESSSAGNVIRGLHYQTEPMAQAKLIRVISGKIFDVAVDLRKGSGTFGKWFGTELDSSGKLQLFIPRGFAHGFSVLSNNAIILYKCDNLYSPEHERSILYDDQYLGIDWRIKKDNEIVSDRDRKNPVFLEAEMNFTI
jgi:dTDP-4-dehydrorhamnose 3,5-epimerase